MPASDPALKDAINSKFGHANAQVYSEQGTKVAMLLLCIEGREIYLAEVAWSDSITL